MPSGVSTQTMARILGPFVAIIGAAVALRASEMRAVIMDFLDDGPLLLITGAFTLCLGLIMIAAHQRWNSAPAIVISVLGWITAVRGAMLLLAGDFVATIAPQLIQSVPALAGIGAVSALLGLWLAFVGFVAKHA